MTSKWTRPPSSDSITPWEGKTVYSSTDSWLSIQIMGPFWSSYREMASQQSAHNMPATSLCKHQGLLSVKSVCKTWRRPMSWKRSSSTYWVLSWSKLLRLKVAKSTIKWFWIVSKQFTMSSVSWTPKNRWLSFWVTWISSSRWKQLCISMTLRRPNLVQRSRPRAKMTFQNTWSIQRKCSSILRGFKITNNPMCAKLIDFTLIW